MRVAIVLGVVAVMFGCSRAGKSSIAASTAADTTTDYGDCRDLDTTGYGCCDDFGTPIKCQTYPMHVYGDDGQLYSANCLCAATHVCFAKDDLQNALPLQAGQDPQTTCAPHPPGPNGQFP